MGILYHGMDHTIRGLNSYVKDVPVRQGALVPDFRPARPAKRSNAKKKQKMVPITPLVLEIPAISNDAEIAWLHSICELTTENEPMQSCNDFPFRKIDSSPTDNGIPQSLPSPQPSSPNVSNSVSSTSLIHPIPTDPNPGEWTFITRSTILSPSTTTTQRIQQSSTPSEAETWILLSDDS